jgi:hypothetical protein
VSWTITDCDGNLLFDGGAPYAECLDLPADYIINMSDSWGDGWNGNVMTIGDNTYTIETGSEGQMGMGACFIEVLGCMDETACNYDGDATADDGSCLYDDCAGECGGSAVIDECGE